MGPNVEMVSVALYSSNAALSWVGSVAIWTILPEFLKCYANSCYVALPRWQIAYKGKNDVTRELKGPECSDSSMQ